MVERADVKRKFADSMRDPQDFTVTKESLVAQLARIALFDPGRLFDEEGTPLPITDLDPDTRVALAGLDVNELYSGSGDSRVQVGVMKKYRITDKLKAIELLAKYFSGGGEVKDRLEELFKALRESPK